MDQPTSSGSGKFGSTKRTQCPSCQKPVYEVEKVKASDGRIYHSRCLKCAHCSCILKGNYHSVEGKFYCTIAHFRANYPTGAVPPTSRASTGPSSPAAAPSPTPATPTAAGASPAPSRATAADAASSPSVSLTASQRIRSTAESLSASSGPASRRGSNPPAVATIFPQPAGSPSPAPATPTSAAPTTPIPVAPTTAAPATASPTPAAATSSSSPTTAQQNTSPTRRAIASEGVYVRGMDPQLAAAAAGASMLLSSNDMKEHKPKLEGRSSELERLRTIEKRIEDTELKESKSKRKGSKILQAPQQSEAAPATPPAVPSPSPLSSTSTVSTSPAPAAGSPLSTSASTVPPLNSQTVTSAQSELDMLREEKRRLDSARRHFNEERVEFEKRVQAESQRLLKEQQLLQNARGIRETEKELAELSTASGAMTDRGHVTDSTPREGVSASPSMPDMGAEDDVKRLYFVRQETKRKLETREMRIEKLKRKLDRLREQRREYKHAATSLQGALEEERATVDGMVKLTEKLQEEIQVLENERLSLMRELRSTKDEYEELIETVVKSAKDALESKSKNKKLVGTWKILEMNNRMQAQQQLAMQPQQPLSMQPPSTPLPPTPLHSTGVGGSHIGSNISSGSYIGAGSAPGSQIAGSPMSTRNANRTLSVAEEETLSISLWSRYPRLPDKWTGQSRIFDSRIQSLNLMSLPEGYNYEFGNPDVIGFENVFFEYEDYFIPFYRRYFYEKEHTNYVGMNDSGAVVISIEKGDSRLKTIIWKAEDHERLVLPKGKDKLKSIFLLHPELSSFKFTQVSRSKFPAELLEYEQKMLITKYKFGVLYVAPGQRTESEWYNNSAGSPQFEEFLEFLGDKIELEGWTKFRGGLHTANQRTGKYSYYTQFHDLEIMYHVSTLLPPVTYDSQQLERKRHLGNDIVLIVFRDAECTDPFDPGQIMSQFNHVFVVVQADKSDPQAGTRYKLAIASKKGVGPYGPVLPEFGIYRKTPEFREFLLTKLINAECAALVSPSFVGKLRSTRSQYLNRLVEYTLSNGSGNMWTSLGRETMKSLRNQFPGARDLRASAREANSPAKEKGPMRQDG